MSSIFLLSCFPAIKERLKSCNILFHFNLEVWRVHDARLKKKYLTWRICYIYKVNSCLFLDNKSGRYIANLCTTSKLYFANDVVYRKGRKPNISSSFLGLTLTLSNWRRSETYRCILSSLDCQYNSFQARNYIALCQRHTYWF